MNELIFLIEDDPDGGYTASALGENIVIQAGSTPDLKTMIRDAIDCHFDSRSQWPTIVSRAQNADR